MQQIKASKLLLLLSLNFLLTSLCFGNNDKAGNKSWKSGYKTNHVAIWVEKDSKLTSSSPAVSKTFSAFEAVRKNDFFKNNIAKDKDALPKTVGILLDESWNKSSGYWASDLKDPDGNPAILISTKAALHSISLEKLLAHELTHLVHHHYRPKEDLWIREGLAILSEYLVTGYHNSALVEGFEKPETSLTEIKSPKDTDYGSIQKHAAQYGHISQFFLYVYRLCGKNTLYDSLLTSTKSEVGTKFFGELLEDEGCPKFNKTFRYFEIARFINSAVSRDTYVYPTSKQTTVRDDTSIKLPKYSASAYNLSSGKSCAKDEYKWGSTRCIRMRYEK